MTPGPSLAVVVKNTVEGGRTRGLATAVGHGVGIGVYALGAVVGFSAVVAAFPWVQRGLALGGGAYLVWLGVVALRRPEEPGGTGLPSAGGLVQGFLTAFLNPKVALFFLALLGAFVPEQSGVGDRLGIAGLAMLIDAGWYSLAALVLARSGAAAWLAARGRPVALGTGGLFIVVGLALVGLELTR